MVNQPGKQLSEAEHQQALQAFEALGICSQLAEAAASLGWKTPSSIQEQAIPEVLKGGSVHRGISALCSPQLSAPICPHQAQLQPPLQRWSKSLLWRPGWLQVLRLPPLLLLLPAANPAHRPPR